MLVKLKDKTKSIVYHLEKKKDKLIKTSIINTLVKQAFSLMIIMATILFNIFGILNLDGVSMK